MSELTDKMDKADKHAMFIMVRALILSHSDLALLLECFNNEAELVSARNLASHRSDNDVEIVQMALDLWRDMIREAAIARNARTQIPPDCTTQHDRP